MLLLFRTTRSMRTDVHLENVLPVVSCRLAFTLHGCGVKVAEDVKCHDTKELYLKQSSLLIMKSLGSAYSQIPM
jgi:hypothetical protein